MTAVTVLTACNDCGRMIRATGDGSQWCEDCERLAEITANNILDAGAIKLENALNPRNAKAYKAMPAEHRRAIVCKAIETGLFTWTIS